MEFFLKSWVSDTQFDGISLFLVQSTLQTEKNISEGCESFVRRDWKAAGLSAGVREELATFGLRLEAAARPELEPVNAVGERASSVEAVPAAKRVPSADLPRDRGQEGGG